MRSQTGGIILIRSTKDFKSLSFSCCGEFGVCSDRRAFDDGNVKTCLVLVVEGYTRVVEDIDRLVWLWWC